MYPNPDDDITIVMTTQDREWDKAFSLPKEDKDKLAILLKDESFVSSKEGQKLLENIGSSGIETFED